MPVPVWAVGTAVYGFGLSQKQPYYDTGIELAVGDYIYFKPNSGAIYPPGRTIRWVSAAGDPGCTAGPEWTLPGVNCWALVARFGDGNPFLVGISDNGRFVDSPGHLYVGINHIPPFIGNGSYGGTIIHNYNIKPPPPPPPKPFLRLPWDYASKGMSFSRAALAINSYFDHEYPLLSTGLGEPETANGTLGYDGEKPPRRSYTGHDGYDYGGDAQTKMGEPVLAAAAGCARYYYCSACGNAITIDHDNGYQTRYYHLQADELVTKNVSICTEVEQGEKIGLVGATGRVVPSGEAGSHLHLMVVEDVDDDGDFQDNIPEGVTDPFGWQSTEPDPWAEYKFNYLGLDRTGNDSHYLWQEAIDGLRADFDGNGGFFAFENMTIDFPAGLGVGRSIRLAIEPIPTIKVSENVTSVGTGWEITVRDFFNTIVTSFAKYFEISIDFSNEDLYLFDPDTLAIYSSEDGETWQEEETLFDWETKVARASANHLSYFILAGELKDTEPPVTSVEISGEQVEEGVYGLPVTVTLTANDNDLGVDYTMYSLNGAEWEIYQQPLEFVDVGEYTLEFYSGDTGENIEEVHSVSFGIVEPPQQAEFTAQFNPSSGLVEISALPNGSVVWDPMKWRWGTRRLTVETDRGMTMNALGFFWQSKNFSNLSFRSLQYPEAVYGFPSPERMMVWWQGVRGSRSPSLMQMWRSSNNDMVLLMHRSRDNKTVVFTRSSNDGVTREEYDGLRLLHVASNNGKLEYSY